MDLQTYIRSKSPIHKELRTFLRGKVAVIFDIGACEAEDSIRYADMYPGAAIYAFEPLHSNVENARKLIAEFRAHNVSIFELALSEEDGTADFYISSGRPEDADEDWNYGNKSSSLLPPSGEMQKHFDWLSFREKKKVITSRLDTFCSQQGINAPDFIHMDVQGAELKVLKGMGSYLSGVKMIWLEVEAVELYEKQALKTDIEGFMSENGFVKLKDTVGSFAGDQLWIRQDYYKSFFFYRLRKKILRTIVPDRRKVIVVKDEAAQTSQRSFSQSGEDMIMRFILSSKGIPQPSYLDIGAHHPEYLSNTAWFYSKGSTGINIEPDPDLFEAFSRERNRDLNLNVGIGKAAGKLDFYKMAIPSLNTFDGKEAERVSREEGIAIKEIIPVEVLSVQDLMEKYYAEDRIPDVLSLDVEGWDEIILDEMIRLNFRPRLICVETVTYSANLGGEKNHAIDKLMKDGGYIPVANTYVNTIYAETSFWKNDPVKA